MDLRAKKTKRNITNAFLQLRSKKDLERITIKELTDLAEISKATFYLHYHDIYELSNTLQNEVIETILSGLSHPEDIIHRQYDLTSELFQSFYAQQNLIETLFSGTQSAVLPIRVEQSLQTLVEAIHPSVSAEQKMLLTYQIQGCFYVYQKYCRQYSSEDIIRLVSKASRILSEQMNLSL